jgi:hypothetical protein
VSAHSRTSFIFELAERLHAKQERIKWRKKLNARTKRGQPVMRHQVCTVLCSRVSGVTTRSELGPCALWQAARVCMPNRPSTHGTLGPMQIEYILKKLQTPGPSEKQERFLDLE